jgi:hypothetical protein
MRTWKNKALAAALIAIGIFFAKVDGDVTFLVFSIMIGIPIFFSKKSLFAADNADYIIEKDGTIHENKRKNNHEHL